MIDFSSIIIPVLHGESYNLQTIISSLFFPIHKFRELLVFYLVENISNRLITFHSLFSFCSPFFLLIMALELAQRYSFGWDSPFNSNQLNMEIHTTDIFSNCCDCLCKEKTVKLDEQIPGVWMNGVYWVCYVCDLFCWFRNNSNWSLC